MAAFPSASPHLDVSMRRRCLEMWDDDPESPPAPESNIVCGAEEAWERLAAYVEENSKAFVPRAG